MMIRMQLVLCFTILWELDLPLMNLVGSFQTPLYISQMSASCLSHSNFNLEIASTPNAQIVKMRHH